MTQKMDVKILLSILWVVVMFNMAFADILGLYIPSKQDELTSFSGGTPITQLMLVGAVILEIPILMIFFSRFLEYGKNRWANIIVGAAMIVFVIGPEVGNDSINPHYIFMASVEVVCLIIIIWTALRWKP